MLVKSTSTGAGLGVKVGRGVMVLADVRVGNGVRVDGSRKDNSEGRTEGMFIIKAITTTPATTNKIPRIAATLTQALLPREWTGTGGAS